MATVQTGTVRHIRVKSKEELKQRIDQISPTTSCECQRMIDQINPLLKLCSYLKFKSAPSNDGSLELGDHFSFIFKKICVICDTVHRIISRAKSKGTRLGALAGKFYQENQGIHSKVCQN